jgi:hypothetical protein
MCPLCWPFWWPSRCGGTIPRALPNGGVWHLGIIRCWCSQQSKQHWSSLVLFRKTMIRQNSSRIFFQVYDVRKSLPFVTSPCGIITTVRSDVAGMASIVQWLRLLNK